MTQHSSSSTQDENGRPRSRTSSQASHRSHHQRKKSGTGSPSSPASRRASGHNHSTSQTIKPSPLKMVTTSTATHGENVAYYYQPEMAAQEQYGGWMVATVIEDDDLMFGGKSLSAWHEEDRTRYSTPEAEEPRGRQRVRQHHSSHHQHHSHKSKSDDQKKP